MMKEAEREKEEKKINSFWGLYFIHTEPKKNERTFYIRRIIHRTQSTKIENPLCLHTFFLLIPFMRLFILEFFA
jgi:hypothetical protein